MLDDEELEHAVAPVQVGGSVERKQGAVAALCERYSKGDAAASARIGRVLLSIADDEMLTSAHVQPVQAMLDLLYQHFDPAAAEKGGLSLAISAGRNGARLSHSHATQYAYVEQSLLLWREILSQLSRMWALAEADLLDGSGYRLRDTGQGIHRVQGAPHVGRFMQAMLSRMQGQVRGGWVGSSAVHLGDNDVPNALAWIDKYTQIPRILGPVRTFHPSSATPCHSLPRPATPCHALPSTVTPYRPLPLPLPSPPSTACVFCHHAPPPAPPAAPLYRLSTPSTL